ncbi:hypothetical protein M378DRAFT_17976 [Amanita muscaria Koide BX008]|uniref:Uncharacterized protein n=1 Tax=Amanita muscaria (strain Koide BX008) TaxID=946122 RepID=A0A0C2SN56_AMAMK|nr:hypothetical protein M378DRAFT_17976 [Amanita muscaria Koide BX008]
MMDEDYDNNITYDDVVNAYMELLLLEAAEAEQVSLIDSVPNIVLSIASISPDSNHKNGECQS